MLIIGSMRRKPGTLVPLEVEILTIAVARAVSDRPDFHGFELAKLIAEHERSGKLLAHGTLYKALNRLAESGMLTAEWEDAAIALGDGRPRRRLYRITVRGEQAAASATISAAPKRASVGLLGLEPT
jgi:PadR family transcriptional regulator, regulatory protein PadR